MPQPANVYDQAARFAAKLEPVGLRRWLLARLDADLVFARWLETQNVPFPGEPDRRCDTVAELVSHSGTQPPWAAVFEFQSTPENVMEERLLEYVLGVRRQLRHGPHGRDRYLVCAVLINLTGPVQMGRLDMVPPGEPDMELRWATKVCTLSAQSAVQMLAQIAAGDLPLGLLPWVALLAGGDEATVIAEWRRLAERETDPRCRAEYGGLALVFADLANRRAVWAEALKGWNMKESVVVKEWQNEARLERSREAVKQVLEARFPGAVPEEVQQLIDGETDADRLSRWLTAAATASSIEEFQANLRN